MALPHNPKLLSLDAAVAWRLALRSAGCRLALTNGVFDLLHPGHLAFLRSARALGDALLVCINSDDSVRALKGPTRPVQPAPDRAFALAACEFIDAVVVFPGLRLGPEIAALQPDAYAKAGDYSLETLDASEREALQAAGAAIHFLPFLPGYSTTRLIARIRDAAAAGAL